MEDSRHNADSIHNQPLPRAEARRNLQGISVDLNQVVARPKSVVDPQDTRFSSPPDVIPLASKIGFIELMRFEPIEPIIESNQEIMHGRELAYIVLFAEDHRTGPIQKRSGAAEYGKFHPFRIDLDQRNRPIPGEIIHTQDGHGGAFFPPMKPAS
jgi:hypothetical protein